ncbi:hypothetical protein NQ318_004617 [Aromia moschata]|uniref:Uncharacterized protein n=1 Tax=Aromia moschata TaxID=1265417 RepID=A0AAV8Y514_9CUCU|nr:hypothetical protein NQ318_004617 [Aromia moschata]
MKFFKKKSSEVILDVYEEKLKYSNILDVETEEEQTPLQGLNLERGRTGVFEMEDLVEVLTCENAEDIFVAKVPNDIRYVDYICITTGKSQRHMQAIAQFVRRVYKLKRHKNDIIPKLEGENSPDWMALDLVVDSLDIPDTSHACARDWFPPHVVILHYTFFSRKARSFYDLDSLWALGPRFDNEYNKKEPVSEMLEKHSMYLEDLKPAS